MQKVRGLITAVFTPFYKDFSVNYGLIKQQAASLATANVKGALVGGTTGEGLSLTLKERKRLAEEWKNHIPGDFLLFVHVGHECLYDAQKLAVHAKEIQADGILLSAPNYFKPQQLKDLIDFNKAIVEGITNMPVYYYHIPSMTGADFPMVDYLQLAGQHIENFKGIKFTHENLDDLKQCIQFQDKKYELIFGRDEILLDALQLGVQAGLGSTYNYMAPLFNEIIRCFQAGNHEKAKELQLEAREIIDIIIQFGGGIIAGKALMGVIGLDCGPLRLPLRSLDKNAINRMQKALANTTLFQYVNTAINTEK